MSIQSFEVGIVFAGQAFQPEIIGALGQSGWKACSTGLDMVRSDAHAIRKLMFA